MLSGVEIGLVLGVMSEECQFILRLHTFSRVTQSMKVIPAVQLKEAGVYIGQQLITSLSEALLYTVWEKAMVFNQDAHGYPRYSKLMI